MTCSLAIACHAGATTNAFDILEIPSILDTTNGVGSWIWETNANDKQTCRFWRGFEIPHSTVASALLRVTVDNGYRLFLDGREIGRGSDWRTLNEYDLTWVLHDGRHVLAVEAFNDRLEGGLICGLRIELMDQRVLEIASDTNWWIVPESESGWAKARQPNTTWHRAIVAGSVGTPPWVKWPIGKSTLPAVQPLVLHVWQTGWFQIGLLVTCGAAVLLCLQLMTRLAVQSKAQKFLHVERARIARDIHDDLGAQLTQLVLLAEVARTELSGNSEAHAQIDQLCARARDLSHAMDEVVWAVNSRRDTLRDFASYVCKYAQLFLAPTSIRCRLDVDSDIPASGFDLPVRRNLFIAVKEALNNAAKHSGASELFLRIRRSQRHLSVTVEDNGKGLDLEKINWERNGMTNMNQRMTEVGGEFRIASALGAGCRLEFIVPLPGPSRLSKWFRARFMRSTKENSGVAHDKAVTGITDAKPASR